MLLKLKCKLEKPVTLPINYQHLVQSCIYGLMSINQQNGAALHDGGVYYNKRSYKLFTFGRLKGKKSIKNKFITFYEDITLEIRSADTQVIELLSHNAETYGIKLGDHQLYPYRLIEKDIQFHENNITIYMDSPITVYCTEPNGKTVYFSPYEDNFFKMVQDNLFRKYYALTRIELSPDALLLKPLNIKESDKVVTRYKDFYIIGWRGTYLLEAAPEILKFVFDTGLGSKNSQGFGMFQLTEDDCY